MRKREPWPWGVTSSSWQNEFFTVFHPKDTSLDNRPQIKEPFWKSTSPVEKFQHNTTGAKKSEIRCIKEDMKNSFTLPVSPLPQGGIAQCHQTPWLVIYPMGESESLRVSAWLPKLCGSLSKWPTSFSFHPDYWVMSCPAGGWGGTGREADSASRGITGTQILLTALWTSSGSLLTSCWWCLICRVPPLAHSTLHASSIQLPTLWLAPCACLWHNESEVLQMLVNVIRKPAPNCRPGRNRKLEHSTLP